jgi:hypothetical protein
MVVPLSVHKFQVPRASAVNIADVILIPPIRSHH